MAKETKKMGRPSIKTPDLLGEFLRRISHGRSISSVCADNDMPDTSTVYDWISKDSDFSERYARACADRGLLYADRISDISDKLMKGEIAPDVARVAIDSYKWISARLVPKLYGDRQTVDVAVTHTHQLHLDALKRLNDSAKALPAADIIEGEIVSVS
jgi:hypothetical protein